MLYRNSRRQVSRTIRSVAARAAPYSRGFRSATALQVVLPAIAKIIQALDRDQSPWAGDPPIEFDIAGAATATDRVSCKPRCGYPRPAKAGKGRDFRMARDYQGLPDPW